MEFYKMLEDLQWSYLKEIFSSVRPWSEVESSLYRTTWIEITGVPLHCWNGTTFRRLAQLWGDFEAFGENLNCSVDCEKMKVLISTKQDQKIWDVVELEVGNLVYNVRIVEVGFMDNSSKKTDTRLGGSPWKEKRRNSPAEPNFILWKGKWLQGNIEVLLGNVYGPSQVKDQQRLWDTLLKAVSNASCCLILGGDFNAIRNKRERSGCREVTTVVCCFSIT
ncbi:hypothetical protein V6N13_033866 [Hibiscus sabdariffa]